jgi:puromycin-sensitive aminopeptidase
MNPKAYRLPAHVAPRHYDIALDARLGAEEFRGHVTIQLELAAPTDTIELHARGLQIAQAQLTIQDQTLPAEVTLESERELAIMRFAVQVPAGPATLDLAYTGAMSKGMEGLFLSKDGPDELLTSQCEATGARAILPCFDEPIFKATFTWQITTAPGSTVLSNGRLLVTAPSADGSSMTWSFAPTKPLSTYLLALTIGDLACTPERVVNDVPLRIWSVRGKERLGGFALDYTARLLPYYEDYFAAPYHFDKLDQVGVPAFGAGAMENAGLIVSQQIALLLDPATASQHQELLVAMVIAHEFAHMWFGDLVTMRWWDDLWLNESFANWMAYHAVDALTPQYRIWDEVQRSFDRALESDSLAGTHPIYSPVETPRDMENFDIITYEKGAAVLRMVHDFLGDEAFRAGLRTYMREFAESNATGADLWRHLQQASHQPVGAMMESWVLQPGHPLVAVALEGDGATTSLRVSQRRFISGGRSDTGEQLWQVPLIVRYADAAGVHEARYLLSERSMTFPLELEGELLWCYPNAGEVGFYRQQLDTALRERLLAHLDGLTPAEQKGLLRDQWALVAAGDQSIATYLGVLGQLAHSDDQTLVGQIVGEHLQRIEHLIEHLVESARDEGALTGFRAWVDSLFQDKLAALGFEPRPAEPIADAQMRAYVLSALTHYAHDAAAIDHARVWQQREAADPASVNPNLAAAYVSAAAEFGDAATYDHYLEIYQQRKAGGFSPQQVERYGNIFGRFQQPELAARTIELLNGYTFPFQSMLQTMGTMLAQPRTQRLAWEFLKAQWPALVERAPFIAPFIIEFSGNLSTSMREDVIGFWEATLHGEQAGPYARAVERLDENAKIAALTREDLRAYFAGKAPTQAAQGPSEPVQLDGADASPATSSAPTAPKKARGGLFGWLRRGSSM